MTRPITAPTVPATTVPDPALHKAAEGFEAIFVRQMLAAMRSARLGEDLFGSRATDDFRAMLDKEAADNIARQRGLGIADMVERQFGAGGKRR